jgi:hypothetical protein
MKLHGVDYTSAPSRRKGITIASGELSGEALVLESLTSLPDHAAFDAWLCQPGPWLAAFDFPFSLPRELVEHLKWPTEWAPLMQHVSSLTRAEMRETFKAFCDGRPVGGKFAHRATDFPAGSSPSMKWVNPPVAYMLHAGVPQLLAAGVTIYHLHPGDPARIAFEGYPGMVARDISRDSYKNDLRSKQTPARRDARERIITALEAGQHRWGVRLETGRFRDALLDDGSGDLLDAALCAVLAAWAWQRRDARYGMPEFDALEGWIVGA